MKFDGKRLLNILFPVFSMIAVILLWQISAVIIGVKIILPTPLEAVKSLINLIGEKVFWSSVLNTLLRSLYSFILAMLAGLIVAVLCYLFEYFYRFINPIIMVMRAVPTMSVILICYIWLTSSISPIVVAFLIVFPAVYSSLLSALSNTDKRLIDMSKLYKVKKKDIVLKLYIPGIAPSFFDTARSSAGLNLKVLIAAEVLSYTMGSIGRMLQTAQVTYDTPALFAWTITAIILSVALEGLISLIRIPVLRRLHV